MMRTTFAVRARLTAVAAVAIVLFACEDDLVGPGSTGSIAITIAPPDGGAQNAAPRAPSEPSAPLGHLTGVTVTVSGPTNKTVSLTANPAGTQFSGTITDLAVGSYTVTVLGLVGSDVDHVGQQTGVQVQANQTTTASITNWRTIVPTVDLLGGAAQTTKLTLPVSWNAITGATAYTVEWATNSNFTGSQTRSVTGATATNIAVTSLATYHVRVRSTVANVTSVRASDPRSIAVVTDVDLTANTFAAAPNYGFAAAASGTYARLNIFPANDIDIIKFDACLGDRLFADVRAERLTPPSTLDAIMGVYASGDLATPFAFSDDAVGLDPQIDRTLPGDDTYYLAIAGFDATEIGEYELDLTVTPGLYNLGSSCGRPDLVATSVSAPTDAVAGDIMRVDITVSNAGNVPVPAGWEYEFRLSTDNVITTADPQAVIFEGSQLNAGATVTAQPRAVIVPEGLAPGTYYVGLVLDPSNEYAESNEANNIAVSTTQVTVAASPTSSNGKLASSFLHTCRVDDAGAAQCWGDNIDGQFGDGTEDNVSSSPVSVPGPVWRQIVAGAYHTCGLTVNYDAFCWGWNGEGQAGDPTSAGGRLLDPTLVTGAPRFVKLAAGWRHTCGIAINGTVWCWGQGGDGQLGNGGFADSDVPVQVSTVATGFWKDIAAGDRYTCAISGNATNGNGVPYCWGDNTVGQIGNGGGADVGTPTLVTGLGLRTISIANWHACGVNTGGTAYCWGLGTQGQLGDGFASNSSTAAVVTGGFIWKDVVAGGFHTCGIRSDSQVWCWGDNTYGQLGDGTTGGQNNQPTTSASGALAVQLGLGGYHSCAKRTDGTYACWGRNNYGQLGNGQQLTNRPRLATPTGMNRVTAGWEHSCGQTSASGAISCWGYDLVGALGDGGTVGGFSLAPVSTGLTNAVRPVTSWWAHTCAIIGAGAGLTDTYCWGFNNLGQIGDNTQIDRASPVLILEQGNNFAQVATGPVHSCAINGAGAAWCWGDNSRGQLGDNTTVGKLAPVAAQGGIVFRIETSNTPLVSIAVGGAHSCGLDTDGDAYCWGANNVGQLGDNTTTDRLVPTPVQAGGRKFRMITAGDAFSCAVGTDNSGWCWGVNNDGELGNGTFTQSNVPVRVSGSLTWDHINAGNDFACGITMTGVGYCWGLNFDGQLGDGSLLTQGSPVQVLGTITFAQISAGNRHACGAATNGNVHCWGRNRFGQVGNNDRDVRSTPTLVSPSAPFAAATRYYVPASSATRSNAERRLGAFDPDVLEGQRFVPRQQ